MKSTASSKSAFTRSRRRGKSTSRVEVQGLSRHGLWLLVSDTEYYLPFEQFPWFAEARVRDAYEVELLHETHLHWPKLDVDLDLDSLSRPDDYPLVYQ